MRMICLAATLLLVSVSVAIPNVHAAEDAKRTAGLSDQEAKEGFVCLFDGKTVEDCWQGSTKGYVPENGVLVCKKHGGGMLYSKKEYADFIFRFEFKLEPGGNNGVAIRTPLKGNPAYVGMEIQILDDSAPRWKNLAPYQYHGSIYGLVPAKRGHLKPVGQWNSEEIMCKGRKVKITLNGAVIVDADLSKVDGSKWSGKGWRRDRGHIGFMGHGSRVEFRNLRIKEL